MFRITLAVTLFLLYVHSAFAGTPASYMGPNNGNWSLPANWSTNPIVPLNSGVNTYDVTVSGKSVTFNVAGNNAVQSLNLTSSTLKLTSGDNLSVVSGLSISGSTINAQSAGFSAAGALNLNSPTFTVSAGGSISLPGMTTLSTAVAGSTLQVDGGASQLLLPNLAALNLSANGFTARAQNAGDLELNSLTAISGSGSIFEGITFVASDANSILRANALTSLAMNGASITLQAQNGAHAEMTSLSAITNTGSIFGSFSGLADGFGSKVSLPSLTTIALNGASDTLRATAGGDLEAPLLAAITNTGNIFEQMNLQATGAGSILNVPLLGGATLSRITVTVQTGGTILWGQPKIINASSITLDTAGTLDTSKLTNVDSTNLTATNGATLSIPVAAYSSTSLGAATWQSSSAGSKLLFPNLTAIALAGNDLSIQAQNGGDIELAGVSSLSVGNNSLHLTSTGASSLINVPQLAALPLTRLTVTVQTGGTILWGQPATLTASSITLDTAGTLDTTKLIHIDSTNLTATNGASLSIPVAAYSSTSLGAATWQASSAGSKLLLPNLTAITLSGNDLSIQAQSGGDVELPAVVNLSLGSKTLHITSTGATSLVNMPLLGSMPLTNLSITVQTGGTLAWGQPTVINGSSITLDTAGTLDTSKLSNIDSTSLTATNGATLSIPVAAYSSTSIASANWQATNAGSKLLLLNLTAITLAGNDLSIQAVNGGDVELPALANLSTGSNSIHISVNGATSQVKMPLAPANLSGVTLSLVSGSVSWGSPTTLQRSSITIDTAGSVNLSALTNVDSTSFTATNGVAIILPLVTTFATSSGGASMTANPGSSVTFPLLTSVSNPGGSIFGSFNMTASGAGAKINMPALTTLNLNGESDAATATSGGDVELPLLATVANAGSVFDAFNISATGAGSLVNAPLLGSTPISRVNVTVHGGTVNWGNPTVMKAGSVTLDTSGTIALAQLINIDSTSFNAANGVSITLPNVIAVGTVAGSGATLQASGSNSTLSLPAMTSINNPGDVFSGITFLANGSGSKTLLNTLQTVTSNAASVTFQAQNGGSLQANALASASSLGSIFANFNAYADGAGSKVLMTGLTTMHMSTATNNLRATDGGDLEMPALTTITATGSIFESFNVQSTGAGSLVNLTHLFTTVAIPDALTLGSGGEIDLAGSSQPFSISFSANFNNGSTGTLDVYLNQTLLTSIAPNNDGTYEPYQLFVGTSQAASAVRFVANGSGAGVTLRDYASSVPEPGTLCLLALAGVALLGRRPVAKGSRIS